MGILVSIVVLFITMLLILPIFFIWRIGKASSFKSNTGKYVAITGMMVGIACIPLFITGVSYISSVSEKHDSGSSYTADGYTIDSYNVKLDVKKDLEVDVTETIGINFYEEGHHGIYRLIPSWLEYTAKDGKTISRKSSVEDLESTTDKYTIESEGSKEKIKIGDPDVTLSTGLKTYTIKYKYYMDSDPYKGFDEFIFHTFGDYWGTTINDATIELTMPEDIEYDKVKFFADKYRKKDISSSVYYYVDGNKLYATVSSLYDLKKSLTIDIDLPEGYFTQATNNYGYISMTFCILIILFTIILFIKWLIHGKDYDKVSETVEFYPPDGLDASQIGYIYKKDTGKKLAIAMIVELASKGYIKIDESEDKSERTITNLYPLNFDGYINRKVVVTKLKDAKNKADVDLLNELFKDNSTQIEITTNIEDFYKKTKTLVAYGFIKIESDTIDNYSEEEINNIKNQLLEKNTDGKPKLTANEKLVYDQLFSRSDVNVISDDTEFYAVFNKITEELQEELDDKINDVKSYKQMAKSSILFLVSSVYFSCAFSLFKDINPQYKILYLISFISLIIELILVLLMIRKNNFGEQIIAKIRGFKNYLETAEKNQIEDQVNKNPNYFYDILPYAYVLGVSKAWIDKFQNIPMPATDMGSFDYCNVDSFDSLSSSVYSGSSSSGGCSSCGGGCSSCGGGGSW